MNKMRSLSSNNLESHRGGKDRPKSGSRERDSERGAVNDHAGGVGKLEVSSGGGGQGGNQEGPRRKWQLSWWSLKTGRLERRQAASSFGVMS